MKQDVRVAESSLVHVENIGGIEETTVELSTGITALIGQNATNRTSLLQAIAGALGSDHVTLKGDAESGAVSLRLGNEEFTRRLERQGETVTLGGDPYLDDPELLDLYGVLLKDNEVRRAVREGADLRDLIMRPIDTEEIQQRIQELVDERGEIDQKLDRLDSLEEELPELEAERTRLSDDLEDVHDRLETKRSVRAELEGDGEDRHTDIEDLLDEKLETLRETRTDLEGVEADLRIERKSLESLREEREAVAEEYASLSEPDEERLAVVEERIDDLRDHKRSLETTISELQRVIEFNKERLEESGNGLLDGLEERQDPDDGGDVTDRLLSEEDRTVCWTCGSEVSRDEIGETIDQLRDLRRQQSADRNELAAELESLAKERSTLEEQLSEHERLSERLDEIDANLERREGNVEELETRRAELVERVADLEREVEELQETQQDELLALQQEIGELTFERDRLEEERAEVEAEMEQIREELTRREELTARREELTAELTDLRTRIDRIEAEAVEGFNTHMAALLDELGYGNIERIWIEPVEREVSEGRRRVTEETFDLHVVRESASGPAYEDRIDHLSESEQELVGLVVALAGYLVHDVAEVAPFMLLDSLEMIDGERLATLVDYLQEYVPYLIVVLLPDHATAFEAPDAPDHERVTEI